jgi:hypothetical protein
MSVLGRLLEFVGLSMYIIDFEDPEVIKRKHQVILDNSELDRQQKVMKWVRVPRIMYVSAIVILAFVAITNVGNL